MSKVPAISVVMSVYNGESYLRDGIESILKQTFKDFEFIIIDDGSKDKSLKIIKSYKDPRIRLVSRPNKGLAPSLNEGLELARGKYVARMDCDDISLPTRLEKQYRFLESRPDYNLVGSNYITIDEAGKQLSVTRVFTHHQDLKAALICSCQYGHGSVLMRRDDVIKLGLYNTKVGVEDYDLWARLSHVGKIANLQEPLYKWRRNPVGITFTKNEQQVDEAYAVRDREFKRLLINRREYHLFSFTPDGPGYMAKKSMLYRDLAYLFRVQGKLFSALGMQLTAVIYQPLKLHNYKRLVLLTLKERFEKHWNYEYL